MQDKEAIEILLKMLQRQTFSTKEKEALETAVGILSWSKLGQSRLQKMGQARRAQRAKFLDADKGKKKRLGARKLREK